MNSIAQTHCDWFTYIEPDYQSPTTWREWLKAALYDTTIIHRIIQGTIRDCDMASALETAYEMRGQLALRIYRFVKMGGCGRPYGKALRAVCHEIETLEAKVVDYA